MAERPTLRVSLGLAFEDPKDEAAFRRFCRDALMPFGRFAFLAGFVLFGAFGILDYYLAGEAMAFTWTLRYALVCPLLLTLFFLTFTERFRPHLEVMLVVALSASGLAIIAMIALMEPPGSHLYYAGLTLVLFFGYALMPLRFSSATGTGWALVVVYEVLAYLMETPGVIVLNNSFFFVSTNLTGMVASFFLDRYRRRDFTQRQTIERDRVALEEANSRLKLEAMHDPLTELFNRRTLMQRVEEARSLHERYLIPTTILFVDLDGFKHINDNHGHAAGDAFLRGFSMVLQSHLRLTDLAFRYGGDEIVVLMPNTRLDDAARVAQRIIDSAGGLADEQGLSGLGVGCSVGISRVDPAKDAQALLDEVDRALYEAKAAGGNRYVLIEG